MTQLYPVNYLQNDQVDEAEGGALFAPLRFLCVRSRETEEESLWTGIEISDPIGNG